MNENVSKFYHEAANASMGGHFHKVIPLHENLDLKWEEISALAPALPRGWYELAHLESPYRIEFTRDFWLSKLPFWPCFHEYLPRFFENVDDIGIFVTQKVFEGPHEVQMVYSLKGDRGFYRGSPPCSEKGIIQLEKYFPNCQFPLDYLAFLKIHDGFSKSTDTGLIPSSQIYPLYQEFQEFLAAKDPLIDSRGDILDQRKLIPFYESFGLHSYQCFFADWYAEDEMGNLYYSGIEHSLSDHRNRELLIENLAFPTFLDWLLFYLKEVSEV